MNRAETHAACRLAERYGLQLTDDLRNELLTRIAIARRHGGRCEVAALLEEQTSRGRERWLVSAGGVVLHTIILPAPLLITFLPPNSTGYQP